MREPVLNRNNVKQVFAVTIRSGSPKRKNAGNAGVAAKRDPRDSTFVPLSVKFAPNFTSGLFAATATGADIRHGGTRGYHAEQADYVRMPPFETLRDAESHAATLAYKLTHWTKHKTRLARDFNLVCLGDEGYAREDLVAVLAAAFLTADLAITPEARDNHAAHTGHWLKR